MSIVNDGRHGKAGECTIGINGPNRATESPTITSSITRPLRLLQRLQPFSPLHTPCYPKPRSPNLSIPLPLPPRPISPPIPLTLSPAYHRPPPHTNLHHRTPPPNPASPPAPNPTAGPLKFERWRSRQPRGHARRLPGKYPWGHPRQSELDLGCLSRVGASDDDDGSIGCGWHGDLEWVGPRQW